MLFEQSGLASVVWNPEEKRPLAEFVGGLFKTTDQKVIKKLRDFGYKTVASDDPRLKELPPEVAMESPEEKKIERIKSGE